MNKIIFAIIVILVIIAITVLYPFSQRYIQYKTTYDDREYNVLPHFDNHKDAAEMLAIANATMISLYDHLREKYQIYWQDIPDSALAQNIGISISSLKARQKAVSNLLSRYNPEVIYETDPQNIMGETSSTIKKGKKMYICLRFRERPQELVNYHALIYVLLHEISHVASDVWGHPPKFWSIFKFILQEAYKAQLWAPIDFAKNPQKYCGIMVKENTLFDPNIKSI